MADIAARIVAANQTLLVTRTDDAAFDAVRERVNDAVFHPEAGIISRTTHPEPTGRGTILVVSGGTADQRVAEEAAVTAAVMGNRVERLYDVGVAGLHRLLSARTRLEEARVIVVAAGMEGALASVVGGLVAAPVVAVPTSVGYGAGAGGRRRVARDAEQLRDGGSGGQHRQRVRRRRPRQPDQPSVGGCASDLRKDAPGTNPTRTRCSPPSHAPPR